MCYSGKVVLCDSLQAHVSPTCRSIVGRVGAVCNPSCLLRNTELEFSYFREEKKKSQRVVS